MQNRYKVGDKVHVKKGLIGPKTVNDGYDSLPMNGTVTGVHEVTLDNGRIVIFWPNEQHYIEFIPETFSHKIGVEFLRNLDLEKVKECRVYSIKIPLIKMLREMTRNLYPHNEDKVMGIREAKELVEEVFTSEQLEVKLYDTDHTNWKFGDTIEVRDDDEDTWTESIFIAYNEGSDYPFVCCTDHDEKDFPDGNYRTEKWAEARKSV